MVFANCKDILNAAGEGICESTWLGGWLSIVKAVGYCYLKVKDISVEIKSSIE